jgi:hypothetical protein
LQDGSKAIATILSIIDSIETFDARAEIITLQNLLNPNAEIITIFNRLGENFQNNSGARALGTDLDNLENLIIKKEKELSPDEKKLLTDYMASIREQMGKLEKIYSQITDKFDQIKKGIHAGEQSPLNEKIAEIDGIVTGTKNKQTITTRSSSDLNVIIQNMRACFSAKTKGCNNDTNLTFGDPYEFYLYSHNETNKTGSIADEIVYFLPSKNAAGEARLSFVIDTLYGQKTSDVFYNHLEVVINKLQNLHQQFPAVPLSILVTQSAMSSIGVSSELVQQKFSERDHLSFEKVENNLVNVPASVFGDHYVEFGGEVRKAGERSVSGLEISVMH